MAMIIRNVSSRLTRNMNLRWFLKLKSIKLFSRYNNMFMVTTNYTCIENFYELSFINFKFTGTKKAILNSKTIEFQSSQLTPFLSLKL